MADELATVRKEAEEYLSHLKRLQADFVNYKRRSEQEREAQIRLANADLLRRVLPVIDDFDRALAATPGEMDEGQAGWATGIAHIVRKFTDILKNEGLAPIESVGHEFDPTEHEAVMYQDASGEMADKVVAEVQRGYRFHDRVLRPAMVAVGRSSGGKAAGGEALKPTDGAAEGHADSGESKE